MAEQFLHKYVLEFGQPISFYAGNGVMDNPIPYNGPDSTKQVGEINSYLDKTEDTTAVKLTEHSIAFEIDKSKDSGNPSTITIYNIKNSTVKFLEQWQGKLPSIILYAGYQTDTTLPILFQGEVVTYRETWEGPTRITTLQLKSGTKNLKEAYTVRSYRAGTKIDTILEELVKDLKLPKGTIYYPRGNEVQVQVMNRPIIVNSPTSKFLKKFSTDNGYKFWIEDGTVNIVPENYVIRAGEFVFDISSDTNMIGSPVATDTNATVQEKQAANRIAITVKTTLNGGYTLTSKVKVTSKTYNGIYEIIGIKHNGVYEGDDWYSTLQLKPVDGWEDAE